jgi:hypothetical protein
MNFDPVHGGFPDPPEYFPPGASLYECNRILSFRDQHTIIAIAMFAQFGNYAAAKRLRDAIGVPTDPSDSVPWPRYDRRGLA